MSTDAVGKTTTMLAPIDITELQWSLRRPRTFFNDFMTGLAATMTTIAMLPLISVLIMLIYRGSQRLGVALFTELPPAAKMPGGGIANALLGTLVMVGLASLISVPVGILGGVYLAEFGPQTRTATVVRFAAKVLTGLPSILAGVVAYAMVVLIMGDYSALAGGIALSILMLPTVVLTAEDAIRMVPQRMKEAALGLGCTQTQAIWHVILPTARSGLLTGVMLAVARAAGETAPLLFTAMFSDYWMSSITGDPTASLAVLIYNFSEQPFRNLIDIAWAASLVLVLIVLGLNVLAQLYLRRSHIK